MANLGIHKFLGRPVQYYGYAFLSTRLKFQGDVLEGYCFRIDNTYWDITWRYEEGKPSEQAIIHGNYIPKSGKSSTRLKDVFWPNPLATVTIEKFISEKNKKRFRFDLIDSENNCWLSFGTGPGWGTDGAAILFDRKMFGPYAKSPHKLTPIDIAKIRLDGNMEKYKLLNK